MSSPRRTAQAGRRRDRPVTPRSSTRPSRSSSRRGIRHHHRGVARPESARPRSTGATRARPSGGAPSRRGRGRRRLPTTEMCGRPGRLMGLMRSEERTRRRLITLLTEGLRNPDLNEEVRALGLGEKRAQAGPGPVGRRARRAPADPTSMGPSRAGYWQHALHSCRCPKTSRAPLAIVLPASVAGEGRRAAIKTYGAMAVDRSRRARAGRSAPPEESVAQDLSDEQWVRDKGWGGCPMRAADRPPAT